MIEVALIGFLVALQDNQFAGYNPFGDVAGLHGQEIGDGCIKEVPIRSKYFVLVRI